MSMVLRLGLQRRLNNIVADLVAEGMSEDADMNTTVDQNVSHASTMEVIPALLQKTRVWNFRAKRLLLPQEHCLVMGIPFDEVISALEEVRIRSLCGNAMHAGALAAVFIYLCCNIQKV